MINLNKAGFIVLFIFVCQFCGLAQMDSVSSVKKQEFRDDTLYLESYIVRSFHQRKLLTEVNKMGGQNEENDLEITRNFYDDTGKLIKRTHLVENRYECLPAIYEQPTMFQNVNVNYILPTNPPIDAPTVSHDSLEQTTKFCGNRSSETIYFLPFLQVIHGVVNEGELDETTTLDSIFFDQFENQTKHLIYLNGGLVQDYRYSYVYDEAGRVLEKNWDNLTPGSEFKLVTKYVYHDDRQYQTYHSYHHFNVQAQPSYSKTYYDKNFKILKHENYRGDSLQNCYYYTITDQMYGYFGVNSVGDTFDISSFTTLTTKNKSESWTYQNIRSSDEYQYSQVDTVYTKGQVEISTNRYSISKEQFLKQVQPNPNKSKLLYSNRQKFDQLNRLVNELEFDDYFGTVEFRYFY